MCTFRKKVLVKVLDSETCTCSCLIVESLVAKLSDHKDASTQSPVSRFGPKFPPVPVENWVGTIVKSTHDEGSIYHAKPKTLVEASYSPGFLQVLISLALIV